MVCVERPHVRDGVDADRRADDADDQGHHDRELVHEEVVLDVHPRRVHDREPERERALDDHEYGRDGLAVLHCEREDHDRDEESEPLEEIPDGLRGKRDELGAFIERRCEQVDRRAGDHDGRDPYKPVPDRVVRQQVQEHGRDQRGEQEEVQYVHKNPLLEYGNLSLLIILDASGGTIPTAAVTPQPDRRRNRAAERPASTGPRPSGLDDFSEPLHRLHPRRTEGHGTAFRQ